MSKLRLQISISIDGFVAGPNQSEDDPLGEGGTELHQWAFATDSWNEQHGREGGQSGVDADVAARMMAGTGAFVMGRNMFGGGPGPWGEQPWNGWWGDNPPFHTPVFVLTHHQREPLEMEGGTTFHFVTDGIESALEQAKEAAAGKDVSLGGGASAAQQYLAAGLVDEMTLNVAPVMLGGGERLFEGIGSSPRAFELIEAVDAPDVSHLRYRLR